MQKQQINDTSRVNTGPHISLKVTGGCDSYTCLPVDSRSLNYKTGWRISKGGVGTKHRTC